MVCNNVLTEKVSKCNGKKKIQEGSVKVGRLSTDILREPVVRYHGTIRNRMSRIWTCGRKLRWREING